MRSKVMRSAISCTRLGAPTGWFPTRPARGWPASIAAVGLGLTAYPVAVERGLISRAEAAQRTLTTLRFFWGASRGPSRTRRVQGVLLSLSRHGDRRARLAVRAVDGRLRALARGHADGRGLFRRRQARRARDPRPRRAAVRARRLAVGPERRRDGDPRLEAGERISALPVAGYDEALLLYVLGLGSPTHPLPAGELSGLGVDLSSGERLRHRHSSTRGRCSPINSRTCGSTSAASGTRSCASTASTISRTAGAPRSCSSSTPSAIPAALPQYGECCWGITASDGPGEITREVDGVARRFFGYCARACPTVPTTARSRRGPWSRRCPSRRRSCCRPSRTSSGFDSAATHPLRIQDDVQSHVPRIRRVPARLGVAVALRHQPGADRRDDRELPVGAGVAI